MNNKILKKLKNIKEDNNNYNGITNIINTNIEDINDLSEKGDTFPYLYAIENLVSGPSFFIDNIDKLDINNKNKYGKTALMALAEKGLIYDVKKLLEAGADWTMKDKNGKIARDYAESYSKETDINKLEDGEDNDPAIYYLLKEWEETH